MESFVRQGVSCMKNVFRVFFSDIRGLFSSFFAVTILLAMFVLPALYAWVNIYANWDPYANTGNIKIALASADLGYTTPEGEYVNMGQKIVDEIASSTAIAWTVVDDPVDAVHGVEDGSYYAALIMQRNLSRNMYEITEALKDEEPSIIFYQNAKTNAIANKITTTAANTARHNIQVQYLAMLIQNVFEQLDGYLERFDAEGTLDDLIELLGRLRDALRDYSRIIGGLGIMDPGLIDRMEGAKDISGALDALDTAEGLIDGADLILAVTRLDLLDRAEEIRVALNALSAFLSGMDSGTLSTAVIDQAIALTAHAQSLVEFMRQALPANSSASGVAITANTLDALILRLSGIQQELSNLKQNTADFIWTGNALTRLAAEAATLEKLIGSDLLPALSMLFDGLDRDIGLLYNILDSVDATVNQIPPTVTAAQSTVAALQNTMAQLILFLRDAADGLDNVIGRLEAARDSGNLSELIEMLHGDPEKFASFLSAPVEVVTTTIYPVENYGSGMAPFYSALAIWVGGVIISAVIRQEAEPKRARLRRPTDGQLFWGRLLIYLLIGQVQAAIIVWGDLNLLGCQCVEPKLLYLVASVTSVVFVTFIYSLILAFGDIGKAAMVVIMVLQIAGSSGSYPIEILPQIFSGIYLFFPFPYAINAMREAMCGLYRYDLCRYLGELLIFLAAGVLIGRVVRRPFIKVNRFIEEEMEETGVL